MHALGSLAESGVAGLLILQVALSPVWVEVCLELSVESLVVCVLASSLGVRVLVAGRELALHNMRLGRHCTTRAPVVFGESHIAVLVSLLILAR